MQACHYAVLGVHPDAGLDQIREAYGLALQRIRASIGTAAAPAPEAMDALRLAYRTLSDPETRRRYDADRRAANDGGSVAQRALSAETPRAASAAPESAGTASDAGARSFAAAASADAAPADAATTRYSLSFTGDGGSYFRIWIVNLLLTVLTLGIYSAWAKVRRERYFHRNLQLDGSAFDYHGDPRAILKGRAIAVLLLLVVSFFQNVSPALYLASLVVLAPVVPWMVVRAYRFRAHNTSYRGLRFSFDGGYREALTVFVGYGLLTLFTVGACFPLWYRAQRRFVMNHLSFGTTRFTNELPLWPVYRIFLVPMLFAVAFFAFFVMAMGGMIAAAGGEPNPALAGGIFVALFAVVLLANLLIVPYIRVRTANLVWNTTRLGPHATESTLRLLPYTGITISNMLLTVLTLGLYQPWAQVRMARYRAENAALLASGSLDEFIAGAQRNTAALGEEIADLVDFDVAL